MKSNLESFATGPTWPLGGTSMSCRSLSVHKPTTRTPVVDEIDEP